MTALADARPDDLLDFAIELARRNVADGGGPFGAVVEVRGALFFTGVNRVTRDNDPTAHAEVVAIRNACRSLKRFDLSDAVLYTSCFPCPMCLSAALWARIPRVVYAASPDDAAAAGFDDARFYATVGGVGEAFGQPQGEPVMQLAHDPRPATLAPFDAWRALDVRKDY